MLHNRVFNRCAWISASKNKTEFSNYAMQDISSFLLKFVCINRYAGNVSRVNQLFSNFSFRRIIQFSVKPNAFITVFEKRMAKNIFNIAMLMVPNNRNNLPIVLSEGIFTNCFSVRAFNIVFCRPSRKIVFIKLCHFSSITNKKMSILIDTAVCSYLLLRCTLIILINFFLSHLRLYIVC